MRYTDLELAEIFFASAPSMTPARYKKLIAGYADALDAIRHAQDLHYEIFAKQSAVVREYLKDKTAFKNFLNHLEDKNVLCLTQSSDYYPQNLLQLDDAPVMLYAKGNVQRFDTVLGKSLSIVGTRHPTRYGERVSGVLAGDLANCGVTIISGLAIGIDACAHIGCLDAGGMTIGIVAGGVDCGIPTDNTHLSARMLDQDGVILSEYAPGTPVKPWMFAPRNRILSGLSCGTLIVQAREKSGAMLTVDHAQEQGKTIFAVPGEITQPASYWPNLLIQQGAVPVLCVQDILDEFSWRSEKDASKQKQTLDWSDRDETERTLLLALFKGALSIEKLCSITELSMQTVMSYLTSLEMEGIIEQFPGRIIDIADAYRP